MVPALAIAEGIPAAGGDGLVREGLARLGALVGEHFAVFLRLGGEDGVGRPGGEGE